MSSETNSIDQMPKKSPLSFQVDLKKFEKATDEEKRQQDVMSESVSFFKDGMQQADEKSAGSWQYYCPDRHYCNDSDRTPCGTL